ncbi:hypothetical protein AGLY_003898 [Aphis glycines]|uniref:Uncharacterized protein n=1 Tax=Aphis glycines TaxID=307491 RepID=A0A6G0TYU7_APHGL|nr:hypothetical protein AGLY_003898 [Aphis glycines]
MTGNLSCQNIIRAISEYIKQVMPIGCANILFLSLSTVLEDKVRTLPYLTIGKRKLINIHRDKEYIGARTPKQKTSCRDNIHPHHRTAKNYYLYLKMSVKRSSHLYRTLHKAIHQACTAFYFSIMQLFQNVNFFLNNCIKEKKARACLVNCPFSPTYLLVVIAPKMTYLRLIHPNITFIYFIKNIEQKFEKHCNSPYILSEHKLSFPCSIHATDIISFVVVYYIRMRLRQFSKQENHKNKKLNRNKKKIAKKLEQRRYENSGLNKY